MTSSTEKYYKMRIRYYRAETLAQSKNSEILRAVISASGLPFLRAEKVNMDWPRITFGPQLPVGYASFCEYADIYFDKPVSEKEAFDGLSRNQREGFKIISARNVPYKFPTVAALCGAAEYSVEGLSKYNPQNLEKFLSGKEITIIRTMENGFKFETDIKPYVYKAGFNDGILKITLQNVNAAPLRVELFLAKWLNQDFGSDAAELKLKEVKIIKQNLYYKNSLGGFEII